MGKNVRDDREHLNRALNYYKNSRFSKSIAALQKMADSKEKHLNLAANYMHLGQYSLARASLRKIKGFMVEAYLNLGLLEYHLENDDLAISIYREGIEIEKNYDLIWNYGVARLRQYCSNKYFDLKLCWQLYETRFRIYNAVKTPTAPNWTGGVHVPSITVMCEQGLGDNIMFSRYLPEVEKWCSSLVVQCEESANALFSQYTTSNQMEVTTTHCISMGSLGNLLDHIPTLDTRWEPPLNDVMRIGLVWRSNNYHSTGEIRNIPVDKILRVLPYGDCYSLGPDCRDSRIPHMRSSTWEDTIANLKQLDILICVDTGIAHLAGSLGMPCLLLLGSRNTDWRWGDKSMGTSNIWYPSVKVIRNPGSWDEVMDEVEKCLK